MDKQRVEEILIKCQENCTLYVPRRPDFLTTLPVVLKRE